MEWNEMPRYNFHSHTYRCGHASNLPDSCYLEKAVLNDYVKYGFTDHVPVHPIFYSDRYMRMHDSDASEYLNAVNFLKNMYVGIIDVYSGFEAEYDEIIEEYLCGLKDSCDYMILGQHYILNKDIRKSPDYPIEYAKKVCAAIESGIFDIVAHPDIFMQYRFSMQSQEDKDKFYANSLIASRMICEKAKEYGVVLELNLGGTHVSDLKDDLVREEDEDSIFKRTDFDLEKVARYPTRLFWEIASEVGNAAVVGIDTHFPDEINLREKKLKKISEYIDLSKINFLPIDYDPLIARRNNPKLLAAYEKTKSGLTSVEGRLVSSLVDEFVVDSKKVKKHSIKTALIRKLRELPYRGGDVENNYFDDAFTLKRRQELVDVIKSSINRMNPIRKMNKEKFKSILTRDIDSYYDLQKTTTYEYVK